MLWQLWLGYHQSVRPCQNGVLFNVDTTAGAFLQARPVIDVLMEAANIRDVADVRQRGLSHQQWKSMKKAVAGLMVRH